MGDAAIGTITAAVYSEHSNRPQNVQFVKAWKKEYGANSTPNFMAVCGWDGMAAIFSAIKSGHTTGDAAMQVFQHWKNPDSPRMPDFHRSGYPRHRVECVYRQGRKDQRAARQCQCRNHSCREGSVEDPESAVKRTGANVFLIHLSG